MDNSQEDDVHYWMGRMYESVEAIQEDIADLKKIMIPDGKVRIEKVEMKIQNFTIWKRSTTAFATLVVASLVWLEAKMNIIGDMFNG